ncbi:AtaL-like protein [Agrobacterium vitis]|uniref:AtaL-like protein n=1 Tax=Agrobacterium vitis TaxID=373 RepID=UPI003D277769
MLPQNKEILWSLPFLKITLETNMFCDPQQLSKMRLGATLSWTNEFPVKPGTLDAAFDVAWEILRSKALSPMSFVPAITSVNILREYGDGSFRRMIVRHGCELVQDVLPHKATGTIRFNHVDDPDTNAIINHLSRSEADRLSYSMAIETSHDWTKRAYGDASLFAAQDTYFTHMLETATQRLKDLLSAKGYAE